MMLAMSASEGLSISSQINEACKTGGFVATARSLRAATGVARCDSTKTRVLDAKRILVNRNR